MLSNLPASVSDAQTTRARLYARLQRLLRSALLVPLLAALAASPSILLLPRTPLRSSLALYVLTRAAQAVFTQARKENAAVVRWVPNWVGGSLWYALGNGQLLWTFLFEPDCFPKSYGDLILSVSLGAFFRVFSCVGVQEVAARSPVAAF